MSKLLSVIILFGCLSFTIFENAPKFKISELLTLVKADIDSTTDILTKKGYSFIGKKYDTSIYSYVYTYAFDYWKSQYYEPQAKVWIYKNCFIFGEDDCKGGNIRINCASKEFFDDIEKALKSYKDERYYEGAAYYTTYSYREFNIEVYRNDTENHYQLTIREH